MKGSFPEVLVLDGDMVPSLAVARSLHRRGIRVDMAYPRTADPLPLAGYSRCRERFLTYPDPLTEPDAFCSWLFGLLQQEEGYRLVIPVTERTLVPLAGSQDIGQFMDRIAIPPRDSLEQVLVKSKTLEVADQADVPYPSRNLITETSSLEQYADSTAYPVVLKPVSSIVDGPTGHGQLSVDYAFDRGELIHKGTVLLERTPFLLQEYVHGTGVGIELIAEHGEIRYAFQHRRIHELPLSGGGSCYRESVAVDPVLLDASSRLISALQWHGVAMVEFKQLQDDGRFWLMEINGRFWGSLPLAVAAGADFPFMLYRLYVEGSLPGDLPPFRTGVRCRRLSADLTWYEQVLRRQGDPRLFTRPENRELVRQALQMFGPGHRFDVQSLGDPLPGLVDLYRIGLSQISRITGTLRHHYLIRKLSSPAERQRIQHALTSAHRILFVCYGNINRSALAEALATHETAEQNIEFRSAGFHPVEGRPADSTMQQIAASRGIDLSSSSSTILDADLAGWADVIFVMETGHLERIEQLSSTLRGKTFLLGSLTPADGDPEIDDPFGKPVDAYERCFTRVEASVQAITISLAAGPRKGPSH